MGIRIVIERRSAPIGRALLLLAALTGALLRVSTVPSRPALGPSLAAVDALKSLPTLDPPMPPSDGLSGESDNFPTITLQSEVPLGIALRLGWPTVVDWASQVDSWGGVPDTDVFWAGYALLLDGRPDLALETWRHRPAIAAYLEKLAWEYHSHPEIAEILTPLAIDLAPDNYYIHLRLGTLRLDQGEYLEALTLCSRATDVQIDSRLHGLRAWRCVGRSAFYLRDWSLAEHAFLARLDLRPEYAETLFWLGRTYRYAGQIGEAESHLRRAIDAAQNQPGSAGLEAFAWYELGYILRGEDRPEEAAAAFGKVLSLRPEFAHADDTLAQLQSLEAQGFGPE